MQTNSLPIQLNANAQVPAQRSGASVNGGGDAAPFGAMLSNEMARRQPALAAPNAETPKPPTAGKPARTAAEAQDAAPPEAAKPEDAARPADTDKAAEAKDTDTDQAGNQDGKSDAQADQARDPASAMLALMASLQQPGQDAKALPATGSAAHAYDALRGAADKGKRGDAAQLAVLQAAAKSVSKDGAGLAGPAGKTFSDTAALRNPTLAAAGAALGTDDRPAAADADGKLGADLRAALTASAGKGQAEQLGSGELHAELSLLQTRETAAAREPAAAVAALAQAQPAVMQAAQAAGGAFDALSARVGTGAWENQVGQKVVYMVGSEEQTASLTLNPPDLGPLQVVLSVSNDQASVTFSANQQEVRQALENALPRLREMMSESGIALGSATVNAGMPDSGQAQQQAARNSGGFGGNGRGHGDNSGGTEDASARPVSRTATLGNRGMVDTFA